MTDPLCEPGHAEGFKAAVHLSVFALAAMCLGYSAMALSQRRQRHLVMNVVTYAALAVFEGYQVLKHGE